jgi:phenylpropionate dioxygenase-like ring-hydroxylating dioxygenase large terminal subunit
MNGTDHPNLARIRQQVIEAASLPLARATTLPRQAYTDEDWFRTEADAVLGAGWICVAHVSQLRAPGQYVRLDLLDEPLLVIRDHAQGGSGEIRVLSRVCPHRAMDIMPDNMAFPAEGSAKSLVCPYHRWSFGFDGQLKGCPEMQRAEGFDKRDWHLAAIRSEILEGFVFVNLDANASPLAEQFAELGALLAPWNCADMELAIQLEWDCDFNWKVMVENWMESYHHLGAHHSTLHPYMPAQDTWTEPEHPHFVRCHLPYAPELAEQVRVAASGGAPIEGFRPVPGLPLERQQEWGLYVGLPCFMVLTVRDRVIWYRLQPISAGRCKLLTTTLVTREATEAPDYAQTLERETRMLRDFHLEDMQVNTAVQHGLRSSRVVRGRLSHLEEPIWLMQRYLASRLQGACPTRAEEAAA